MPDYQTIRSYLVGLGYKVDEVSSRKFEDALKRSSVMAERFAKGAVKDFTLVGGTFAAAAAAVVAGTAAMATSVANQDLQYQLLARRMFMTTDAVRKMDFATKALGYTLPEIIFGPKELQERYHILIQDETRMLGMLGGDQGETAFRRIRDIEFQFTRLEPAIKIFGMRLTEDIINKMFGGTESLEVRMKQFVDWFESPSGFVRISDKISNVLVPAFEKMGRWAASIFSDKNINWVVNVTTKVADDTGLLKQFVGSDNKLGKIWDKDKSFSENMSIWGDAFGLGTSKDELIGKAAYWAKQHGADAKGVSEFQALIDQETGGKWNINAQNPRTHAFGLGQVMPNNWPAGRNGGDPDTQLDVAAGIFFGNLDRRKGDYYKAGKDYYGWGKAGPGEPTPDEYYKQWQDRVNKFSGSSATVQPQAYHSNMGGVTIHINQPNATKEEIQRAVKDGINEHETSKAQQMFARAQGAYA
jgi:hypothetical protein